MQNQEPKTNGELAYDAMLVETMAFNASRRSVSYRLLSSPDIVVKLPGDAHQLIAPLFEQQDKIAADLSAILPHVVLQTPEEPIYSD